VPSWTHTARVEALGQTTIGAEPGTYVTVGHPTTAATWRIGDRIDLYLPTVPRFVGAHPRVATNAGQVALARGPIVHCLEAVDHPGVDVSAIEIDTHAPWETHVACGLPHDIVALRGLGYLRADSVSDPDAPLYRPLLGMAPQEKPAVAALARADRGQTVVTAVPYFAWANRVAGAMTTWIPVGVFLPSPPGRGAGGAYADNDGVPPGEG
jgi:DUF1680 family protein